MYRPGKILKTGTWTDTGGVGAYQMSSASTVLDLDQGVPAWRGVAPMKWARSFHNLTVLPDGNVLSLGGQSRYNPNSLADSPVLQPEIWNPTNNTWTAVASHARPRGYHNTSLLLPDGRILLAGSGRLQGSAMINETNAEIYSPPYCTRARGQRSRPPPARWPTAARSRSRRLTPPASRRSASSGSARSRTRSTWTSAGRNSTFRQVARRARDRRPHVPEHGASRRVLRLCDRR